ncbi:MAG: hypothetical protein Q9208_005272 [Pyrenodesmia sp. 3 TL-2023]
MEVLHASPTEAQFTTLSTHQSQTPSSFYTGSPVLHHLSQSTTLLISSTDLKNTPAFANLARPSGRQTNGSAHAPADDIAPAEDHQVKIEGVDIWVTSEYDTSTHGFPIDERTLNAHSKFLLFSPTVSAGVSIPYPSISLHAIQRSPEPSLLLQLLSSASPQFDDHDPEGTISLTIIPSTHSSQQQQPLSSSSAPSSQEPPGEAPASEPDPLQQLFSALSACADLHPDPASDSDIDINDDGADPNYLSTDADTDAMYTQIDGLPPPMPGSGGWITAENVGEFFDEEGNFRGGGRLGEGAGSVRGRDVDGDEDGGGNGVGGGEEQGKWRRTG